MRLKKSTMTGFTLMEVLVALIILSVAFTSLFLSTSSNVRTIQHLQDKTAANWVALNVIAGAQLGLINVNLNNSHVVGQDIMFDRVWYWEANVQSTRDPFVLQLEVAVGQDENSPNIIHLIGYLRKPV